LLRAIGFAQRLRRQYRLNQQWWRRQRSADLAGRPVDHADGQDAGPALLTGLLNPPLQRMPHGPLKNRELNPIQYLALPATGGRVIISFRP
jgi:hypothetical protein